MAFYRKYWYFIGGIIFVALAYYVTFFGSNLSHIRVILIYSFMAMLVHQFEEYGIPGGFPRIGNQMFGEIFGDTTHLSHYPLNANQVLINNVFMTYPFYILAIIFPGAIWYGLIQIGQGMVQIINHVFVTNIQMKTLYNPGEASVLLLHWPLGIYYIWYVTSHHLASTTDLIVGFFGSLVIVCILWLGPVYLLKRKDSKYDFSSRQMSGYLKN